MKKTVFAIFLIGLTVLSTSCNLNPVKGNEVGVLQTNYGRSKSDFKIVNGSQGFLWFGEELYTFSTGVQRVDINPYSINGKGGGSFIIDPKYSYRINPSKAVDIIFDNQAKLSTVDENNIIKYLESNVLNNIIYNVYVETAKKYTPDSLLNNQLIYTNEVEGLVKEQFAKVGVVLDELVSELKPNQAMQVEIDNRNASKIKVETERNQLETEKVLLEKERIRAETNKVRSQSLDSKILQEKWIEAIKPTDKVIITDGKTPVIIQ